MGHIVALIVTGDIPYGLDSRPIRYPGRFVYFCPLGCHGYGSVVCIGVFQALGRQKMAAWVPGTSGSSCRHCVTVWLDGRNLFIALSARGTFQPPGHDGVYASRGVPDPFDFFGQHI